MENVRVVVRCRPMDKIERDSSSTNIIKVEKFSRSVTVTKPNSSTGEPPKTYYFDNVFGEESTQVGPHKIFFSLTLFTLTLIIVCI